MNTVKSIFSHFPEPEALLNYPLNRADNSVPDINAHIHTPHSFSAFSSIEEAFQLAKSQNVSVLGINDFYTTDGYDEFAVLAQKYHVFPLFNIEFMALQADLQAAGIRVNDPGNPGRTYLSGKGLRQPAKMSEASAKKIEVLQAESNRQTYQMVEKLNALFASKNIAIRFDAAGLQKQLAKNLFRERHIAQAVRLAVFDKATDDTERKALITRIFSGQATRSAINDAASLENEIRSKLLKAGGAAFIPEDAKAFLSLEEVTDIIMDAGGIPCYPVLLDFGDNNFTNYERNMAALLENLKNKNIFCIELIPGRNTRPVLKEFVRFFRKNQFLITFGTEHNTPMLDPMRISCGGQELDDELKQINHEGAAVIAAHQYLMARGGEGYLKNGIAKTNELPYFIQLGKALIHWFISGHKTLERMD